jgi:hypothetical protein
MNKFLEIKESVSHVKGGVYMGIYVFGITMEYALAVRVLKLKIHISLISQEKKSPIIKYAYTLS